MLIKNEQTNFIIIISLLLIAISIIFFLVKPPTIQSFIPYLLIIMPIIFLIALFNTDVALVLLIFSMLLSPELSIGGVRGRAVVVRLDDIFLLLVFLGWMAKMAVNKEFGFLKTSSLIRPIFLYILICIISSGIGVLRGTTKLLTSFLYIFKYFEYFLVFFMVRNSIRSKTQLKTFLTFMFITAVIVGVFGMYVALVRGVRATAPFEGRFGEANTLAGYLLLMMSIAAGIFLYVKNKKWYFLMATFLLFSVFPFLHTYSRSGLLGLFSIYIVLLAIVKRYKLLLIASFVILAIIGPIMIQKDIFFRARQTFSRGERFNILGRDVILDESAAARINSFNNAIERWAKNPVIGEGVGSGRVMHDIQYGRLLREVGTIGTLAFFWIISMLLKIGWRTFRNTDLDDFSRGLSLGYFCAIIGLLFMGFGAEVFIIIRISEPFWFITAMVVCLPELSVQKDIKEERINVVSYG